MDANTIHDFESDNGLMKVLMNNFGSVLVFIFYAEWNQPSKQFLNNLSESIPIFGQYDNVKYYSFCAERCSQIFGKFGIEKTPTVLFTQSDKKVLLQYEEDDVGSVFDNLAKISEEHKEQFEKERLIWHPKAKNVVESCPVIVFAKGTPTNPKCGFSRQMFEIMKEHDIEYAFYDIIEDQKMRHWLRHYIKWPTYPMVFVSGKLVGGLDSVRELIAKGQFQKMVPESARKGSPEDRYNKFINQNQTVVFCDGFPFENKETQIMVQKVEQKYGQNAKIYNVAIEPTFKAYITDTVGKKLPYLIHKKNVTEI